MSTSQYFLTDSIQRSGGVVPLQFPLSVSKGAVLSSLELSSSGHRISLAGTNAAIRSLTAW